MPPGTSAPNAIAPTSDTSVTIAAASKPPVLTLIGVTASAQVADASLTVAAAVPLQMQSASLNRTAQIFAPVSRATWQEVGGLRIDVSRQVRDESGFEFVPIANFAPIAAPAQARSEPVDTFVDVLSETGERIPWVDGARETTALIGTGVVAATGYIALNTRLGLWLLSLLTSQPLWRQFDPLEVLYAWEANPGGSEGDGRDEETLATLVDEW
jgi:hypothetical protein